MRKIGNPVDFANKYFRDGADQLNIIDIVASLYNRDNLYEIVNKITEKVYIPVCVGGGIKSIEHIKALLECGADRVIKFRGFKEYKRIFDQINKTFGSHFFNSFNRSKKNRK